MTAAEPPAHSGHPDARTEATARLLAAASRPHPSATRHCRLLRLTGWFVPGTGFLVDTVVGNGPAT